MWKRMWRRARQWLASQRKRPTGQPKPQLDEQEQSSEQEDLRVAPLPPQPETIPLQLDPPVQLADTQEFTIPFPPAAPSTEQPPPLERPPETQLPSEAKIAQVAKTAEDDLSMPVSNNVRIPPEMAGVEMPPPPSTVQLVGPTQLPPVEPKPTEFEKLPADPNDTTPPTIIGTHKPQEEPADSWQQLSQPPEPPQTSDIEQRTPSAPPAPTDGWGGLGGPGGLNEEMAAELGIERGGQGLLQEAWNKATGRTEQQAEPENITPLPGTPDQEGNFSLSPFVIGAPPRDEAQPENAQPPLQQPDAATPGDKPMNESQGEQLIRAIEEQTRMLEAVRAALQPLPGALSELAVAVERSGTLG